MPCMFGCWQRLILAPRLCQSSPGINLLEKLLPVTLSSVLPQADIKETPPMLVCKGKCLF